MSTLVEAYGLEIAGRLQRTDLQINAGLTCLIGPNGSGKTSLLHALAGIGEAKGSVGIGGVELRHALPDQRLRLLGFLPASREIAWPLAARDLIGLGLPGGHDAGEIDEIVAALELTDLLDRRIDRLSTGERSRVLIARALAQSPLLLLLDEPISNLDPLWQLRLMDHLAEGARKRRQALLLALHDLELARTYADRLIVMDEGGIAADGSPEAIMASDTIPRIFGVRRDNGRWVAAVRPPEDQRSSL